MERANREEFMSMAVMASPRSKARTAGVFYLMTILTGVMALISGNLVVSGDAAATATNILGHETLFRSGFAADVIAAACYVAVAALFYDLFKPVNRNVSLLAAFFGLVGSTVAAFSNAFQLAPFVLLKGAPYLSVFTVDQLQALALMFLKLRVQASNIAFVFFGLYCLLIGWLIFRSTFLPRVLGVLMAIAGLCWLISSFASFLSPPLARHLFPYIMAGALGEVALTVWLLVAGVNPERWTEQAGPE
jgi:uncharacterized protein DUF4386